MFFYLLYKMGTAVALGLPLRLSYAIASAVARVKYIVSRTERREMLGNLKQVLPGESAARLKQYSKEIFKNFALYLVDFLRFDKLSPQYIEEGHVGFRNKEAVDSALKEGKGVIIVSAHLGSWELGGAALGVLGYPTNVVVLGHKNKLVNDFFVRQRAKKGEKVISIGIALKQCFKALRNGEALAIVGDKDFTNHGIVVKFFGKDTIIPKGPAFFSLKTGAAIVPGFVVREDTYNVTVEFGKRIEYAPTGDFEKDVFNLTQLCTSALEKAIRMYPTQWYCFRRFWI